MVGPDWVVAQVIAKTHASEEQVREFIATFQHVVDKLVTADVGVMAPPLLVVRKNDPVWERLAFLAKDRSWVSPEAGFDATPEELAAALNLPLAVVERFPIASEATILVLALEALRLPDTDGEHVLKILRAWVDTYAREDGNVREYRVNPVGRESIFEDWLIANLGSLSQFGYDVRLANIDSDGIGGRQPRLDKASRADLVCRISRGNGNLEQGDWLVIENKATSVGVEASFQLSRYVDLLSATVNDAVHGLLIADGISVNLERALAESGFGYLSLSEIGYRDVVRRLDDQERELDATPSTIEFPGSVSFASPDSGDELVTNS